MKGARWTDEDEALLITFFRLDQSLLDMCLRFDRTCTAIVARLVKLKLLRPVDSVRGRGPTHWICQRQGQWVLYTNRMTITAIKGACWKRINANQPSNPDQHAPDRHARAPARSEPTRSTTTT